MNVRDRRASQRRKVPFLLWGWAMLLVVLMSAAPSGAQVRTRLVGSAFDPASVSVALSPKQIKTKSGTAGVRGIGLPRERQDGPPLTAIANVACEQGFSSIAAGPVSLARAARVSCIRAGLSPRAHGARAPPLA